MKHTVETLTPTRARLTIEVPFSEMEPSFDQAFKRIAQQVNIPGFRKGKVPRNIIEQRFGRAVVLEEAINDIVPKAYDEAIRQAGLVVLSRPEIDVTDLKDGEQITFTADVDVRPDFDLPNYEGVQVEVDPAVVTDEQIDEQLTGLRSRFATLTVVERAAADGDIVVVNISGADAGAPIEDLTANALSYELGTNGMLPGFDDAVRGASAGDIVGFSFDAEGGEYAGKSLDVSVEVVSVRERTLPAADDSFAQLASEFDTIDELRADLRTRLERVRLFEQGFQARERILEKLIDMVDVPIPHNLVDAQVDDHFRDGHGDDDHRADFVRTTQRSLVSSFVLDRIADKEEVAVSEAELTQWLISESQRYGMTPDAFAKALTDAGNLGMAFAEVRRAKALSVVLESAQVIDTQGTVVDLSAVLRRDGAETATDGIVETD